MSRIAPAAAALLLSGCGLFPTRTPSEAGGGESVWLTPVSPQIIVENLRSAFEAGNFGDYARTMTEDFVFVPDERDVFAIELIRPGEGVFLGWDRSVETQTAEVIFGSVPALDLVLSLIREELIAQYRLLKYQYVLTLTPAAGDPSLYEGEAWFRIRQEPGSGEWYIFEWEDIASVPLRQSWGYLKGLSRPASRPIVKVGSHPAEDPGACRSPDQD
jgi:hypothetical protein